MKQRKPAPRSDNAVKHFCEAFLVKEWWSDCLHSTRLAKKNVREAGTLRLRPGWADTTSAGAVRPRNSADDSQRPGGPTHKKGEASQLVSAFQAFDSTQRFFPGPYSPGKGCVGPQGLRFLIFTDRWLTHRHWICQPSGPEIQRNEPLRGLKICESASANQHSDCSL